MRGEVVHRALMGELIHTWHTPGSPRRYAVWCHRATSPTASGEVVRALVISAGTPGRDPVSPAREQDRRPLTIDACWRGYGLLADLGYVRMERLRAREAYGVRVELRLKDHWQPKVDAIARGQVTQSFLPGTDLDALRVDEPLVLDGQALDADVPIGGGQYPLHPRRLALQLAVSCQSIAHAFDLQGAEATQRWDASAALLTHSGQESALAPAAFGLRSVTGLEASARGSKANQATHPEGRGLSGHLCTD